MICENCRQREATIRYVQLLNGAKKVRNLCPACLKEIDPEHYAAVFEKESPFANLLSGLLGITSDGERTQQFKEMSQIVCPTCGTTYEEFTKDNVFGCEDCYSVFGPLIGDKLKNIQGNVTHTGKHPLGREKARERTAPDVTGELTAAERISLLEFRLKEAVAEENYELAAQCRDEIRALKAQEEGK